MGVWLVLDIFFFGIRSAGEQNYWSSWSIQIIPLAIATVVYFLAKPLHSNTRLIIISLACGYALLCWSSGNVKAFEQRVDSVRKLKAMNQINAWEQMGEVIKKNSDPDDGLYVWGWMPGIYVAAQRFSPATQPAYSNMHTDAPKKVGGHINRLLKDFESRPPKFIVDSQKKHYPYNTHPNFQLWPVGTGPDKKPVYVNPAAYQNNKGQILSQIEEVTFQLLSHPKRPGGPVPADQARKMAQAERNRHEAMEPLREYVMKHYQPVVPAGSSMTLFKKNEKPTGSP